VYIELYLYVSQSFRLAAYLVMVAIVKFNHYTLAKHNSALTTNQTISYDSSKGKEVGRTSAPPPAVCLDHWL